MVLGLSRPSEYGILVPQLRIKPAIPALQGGFLTTGTTREVLALCLLLNEKIVLYNWLHSHLASLGSR